MKPMKLITILSYLFESFSFHVTDLVGVGTINNVTWYIYLVTPKTTEKIESLINNCFILCPRDKNLFINSFNELNASSNISLSILDLNELKTELNTFSSKTNQVSLNNETVQLSKDFELNISL